MGGLMENRSYAVVIGVNGAGIFNTAESNAQAVAETLASPAYRFITFTLTGSQATRSAILETLQRFQRTVPPARILIYFAGHSIQDTGLFLQVADDLDGNSGLISLDELLALGLNTELFLILDTPLPDDQPGDQANPYSLLTGRIDDQTGAYYPITGPLLIALSSAARLHAPDKQPYTVDDLVRHLRQNMAAAYGQNGQFELIQVGKKGDSFSLLAPQDEAARQNQPTLRFPPPPGTLSEGQRRPRKPSRLSQWTDNLTERVGLMPIIVTAIIAGMFITALMVGASAFIGRYSLRLAVVPRNQTATPAPLAVNTSTLPAPYPSSTPRPPATFSTPFPPFGGYVGESGYRLVTIQQVGNIPPGELVRIEMAWFDYENNLWKYNLVTQDGQLTGVAHAWQIALMDDYIAPTPTARYMTPRGGYIVVTLEQVGTIPAGSDVRVSSAWYNQDRGWTYSIVAEDGITTADALEYQLAFKPGIDPYAPTPTSEFLINPTGQYLLTTERISDIPAGTRVQISESWFDTDHWVYVVYTDYGEYAEAREDQLIFAPTPTPGPTGTPTPTPPPMIPPIALT